MSDEPIIDPVIHIDPSAIKDPVYQALAARFEPLEHGTLAKAGGQTYVPWNLIANRLNVVLGVEKWSFRILREGFTASECWVLGELSASIRDTVTVRQQYGVSPLTVGSSQVDDLLKKAGTDALKKCAQVLGVALYLTDADERAEVKAEMAAARRQQPNPTTRPPTAATPAASPGTPASRSASTPAASSAAPTSSSTTATPAPVDSATLQQRWQRLVAEAERVKLPTLGVVKAIDPKAVSAAQLETYAHRLEERLYEARAVAGAV